MLSSANPSVPHPAKVLFPTIAEAHWRQSLARSRWTRNDAAIRIREKLTPGKIYILRKDGL